jgi:hypothetical protein
MVVLHAAKNPAEAHLLRALLADAGIESLILNEMLQAAQGDFGLAPEVAPQVALLDPRDHPRALAVLEEMLARSRPGAEEHALWSCAACGEENDSSFELCWQCQAPRPGLAPDAVEAPADAR